MTSVYALSERDRNGSFLVELNRHLVAVGHEIHVLAPSYEGCRSHVVEGIAVHRFRYFLSRWEHLTHGQGAPSRIRNPFYFFVAFFYIVAGLISALRLCRRLKFDLIHVHWPFPHGVWGYIAGRVSNTPVVLSFHGAELALAGRFAFVEPLLRHAARHADALICNSSFTAAQVARLSDKPLSIIPFGVTITPQPVLKNTAKPVKDILFVGRLIPRKGVDYLIRAVPHIRSRLRVQIHIVGDGNMRDAWMSLARELGVADLVQFHGAVSNDRLAALYAEADVFVLPAIIDDRGDTEGLGVVLIEALASGTPVVASNVGGIPDVIQDYKSGLLVPQKDVVMLSEAIVRLLNEPDLARTLSACGLARAQSYFDWRRIVRCIDVLYSRTASSYEHSRMRDK